MNLTQPPNIDQCTVVLVEDDDALANALRFTLEIEGWAVVFHASGEALLANPLPAGRICIVCDLRLPGMSGIEALQELRTRGVEAPAILITGDPTTAERRAVTRAGVGFVPKPLLSNELLDAIRGALAR